MAPTGSGIERRSEAEQGSPRHRRREHHGHRGRRAAAREDVGVIDEAEVGLELDDDELIKDA